MPRYRHRFEEDHPTDLDYAQIARDLENDTEPTKSAVRAAGFLERYAHLPDVQQRAAVILMADEWAPDTEKWWGGRHAAALEGQQVRCRGACGRTYTASAEDPYLNATGTADGCCSACFILTESRLEHDGPVLTGTVLPPGEEPPSDPVLD